MPMDATPSKKDAPSSKRSTSQETNRNPPPPPALSTKARPSSNRGQQQQQQQRQPLGSSSREEADSVGPMEQDKGSKNQSRLLNKRSVSSATARPPPPPPPLPRNTITNPSSTATPPLSGTSQTLASSSRRAPPPHPLDLKSLGTKSMDHTSTRLCSKMGSETSGALTGKQQTVNKKQDNRVKQKVARSESKRRLVDDMAVDSVSEGQQSVGSSPSICLHGTGVVTDYANCDSASIESGSCANGGASGGASSGQVIGGVAGGDGDSGVGGSLFGHSKSFITKNLVWAVFASAVGSSFQHGYNGGVVNAPEKLIGDFVNGTYKERHNEYATETQLDLIISIIVSIFCIGGCLGALLTAFVADRIGRKEGLMYNNLLVLIASPLMASSRSVSSYELLILGRFLIGINAGLNAGLAPLYLNEIAPVQLRGALGTIYQLVITISILLSNIFGLPNLLGNVESWPILFALPIIPAAFMLAALPHCCESPKHLLLNQGKELQAQQALAWLRETGDVQEEMEELRNEREMNMLMNNRQIGLADMLGELSLRKPLTIAIVIMLSQQFSGINAVLFYSTSIFRDAGLSERSAVQATLGMSVVNVAMTLVSLFLVDRCGRRTLHMTGLMGMAASCLVLALCLNTSSGSANNYSPLSSSLAVVAVYVFIAMFASGPGSIPWFLVAELFPSNARPLASSIAVSVNWLANFTVSLCFLPLSNVLHGFTFVLFAILLVIFYLFTYYKVPETKGATAEEISALFRR